MSTHTDSTRFLPDFAGRQLTAIAIGVAALGSASLNVYGASQIFPNPVTAWIFGIVIAACEVIAALTLRHIMADAANRRYRKAAMASVMLVFAIAGCVISGKQAFHVLFLEANANHGALTIRSDRLQEQADAYHERILAGELTDITQDMAKARLERMQAQADEAHLAKLKSKPPHISVVFVLLALFEMVKIGGLWAIATPTTKGQTWRQQRAQRRRDKLADAEAEAKFRKELARFDDEDDNNVTPFPVQA